MNGANRFRCQALAALLLLVSWQVFAGPSNRVVEQYLHSIGFAGSLDAIDQDDPLVGGTAALVSVLLARPGWLSDQEGEILIERALRHSLRSSPQQGLNIGIEGLDSALSALVNSFVGLQSWSLRELVLRTGTERSIAGIDAAVMDSARRLASLLQESVHGVVRQPYEREAAALAAIAEFYPSNELAELLRTIAMFSADRDVVTAARAAARRILDAESDN